MITLVIPNFALSLTVSEITTFLEKMAKLTNLANLAKKKLKYGALTYYNPCDPKFRLFRSISHRFGDSDFWPKKFRLNFN